MPLGSWYSPRPLDERHDVAMTRFWVRGSVWTGYSAYVRLEVTDVMKEQRQKNCHGCLRDNVQSLRGRPLIGTLLLVSLLFHDMATWNYPDDDQTAERFEQCGALSMSFGAAAEEGACQAPGCLSRQISTCEELPSESCSVAIRA